MNNPFFRNSRIAVCVLCSLMLLLSSGCSTRHKASKKKPHKIETVVKKKNKKKNGDLVDEALSWIGTPYKYGCSEKGKGTDCSGMVLAVYEDVAGIRLPRNSKKQSEFCQKLKQKDVRPGDLVFFATGKDKNVISHVGIMIDDNQFVHASAKKGVIISDMLTDYYIRTFKMYGRVPGSDK